MSPRTTAKLVLKGFLTDEVRAKVQEELEEVEAYLQSLSSDLTVRLDIQTTDVQKRTYRVDPETGLVRKPGRKPKPTLFKPSYDPNVVVTFAIEGNLSIGIFTGKFKDSEDKTCCVLQVLPIVGNSNGKYILAKRSRWITESQIMDVQEPDLVVDMEERAA